MTDLTILYMGVFCFAMTLLGLGLTIIEFTGMRAGAEKGARDTKTSHAARSPGVASR